MSFTPDLDAFRALVEQPTELTAHPHATEVRDGVLLYDAGRLLGAGREEIRAELAAALADGPGIVVVRGAFPDTAVVDRATAVFDALIAAQRAAGTVAGDHFAAPGA